SSGSVGVSFLELGLDSLLLSQAAVTISRKFGVKVTFRQLLQDTGTLESLAAHIASQKPAVKTTPATTKSGKPTPPSPQPARPAPSAHGPFRPPQRELGARLSETQRRWL